MYSRNKLVIFPVFFIFLVSLFTPVAVFAQQPDTPTILSIKDNSPEQPVIMGTTPINTEVLIYIDGSFSGLADISTNNNEVNDFNFTYPAVLEEGEHTAWAVARDKTSLLQSDPLAAFEFIVKALPAPTLISPNENTITGKVKPFITGLTVADTFVHIWIDGIYNGKTAVLKHESGTANFAYRPFLNLAVGEHTVWAIAEDQHGRKSRESEALRFNIEPPMPAPVIYKPVVNSNTIPDKPYIVGLAKNDSFIKVYIDNTFFGQFPVDNHESGTANFAYIPFVSLATGLHFVYTEAIDQRGKISNWSNIVYFNVYQPTITSTAAEEQKDTIGEISEEKAQEEPLSEIVPGTGDVEDIEVKGEESELFEQPAEGDLEVEVGGEAKEIEELLKGETGEEEETTGLLDESKSRQGGLQLNLVIFIVFLLAVIAWIFWVNRELIKERRALTEAEDDAKKNKDI